jgi:transcription initiation factor TFIIB
MESIDSNMWNMFIQFQGENNDFDDKKEKTSIKTNVCIECGKDNLLNDGEYITCLSCGVQNGQIIDHNQEWRNYNNEGGNDQDQSRCGMPLNPLLPDCSLTTVILGKGNECFKKLNSWNGMTYRERSLINVLNQISKKAKLGNIPNCIVDKTIAMYRILSEDHIKRGESRESLIAACLLYALKDKNITRSANEISNLFGIKNKKLTKGCNEFTKIMYEKNSDYIRNIKPIEPEDLINRYCDILEITQPYKNYAINVSKTTDYLGLCSENNPKSIAVGAIYLIVQAYDLNLTKKDISEKCITSDVTITKIYNSMVKYQDYLLPDDSDDEEESK